MIYKLSLKICGTPLLRILIIGMKDDMLRQRLLQEVTGKELTAERVIECARTKEIGSNQSEEIRGRNKENIDYVQNDYKKNKFEYKRGDTKKKCSRCNNIHEPKKCKAYGTKCANCKRTGHWAVCCRSKKVDEVRIEKKQSSRKRRVYILRRSFKMYLKIMIHGYVMLELTLKRVTRLFDSR